MDSAGELSVCFSDILTKFHSVSGLNFKLKKEQDTAVKCVLLKKHTCCFANCIYGTWQMFATRVLRLLRRMKNNIPFVASEHQLLLLCGCPYWGLDHISLDLLIKKSN